jgi:hypothetical protein
MCLVLSALVWSGCAEEPEATDPDDAADSGVEADAAVEVDAGVQDATGEDVGGEDPGQYSGPLPLTATLCDDPGNMDTLLASPMVRAMLMSGNFNTKQVERMIANPTDGPFYMVNLIRFREFAMYPDGSDADLSGREANDRYSPTEFIAAIGARPVFVADVANQIDGDDTTWESVGIVEYPCPVAFFAMITTPEFQERAVHKTAGVEETIVIVTDRVPLPAPTDPDQSEAAFPPTAEDPAFDLIHVMDFHDTAQYGPDSGEPERTGREAWEAYQANGSGASSELGHYPTAILEVQGAFIGDGRSWDQIQMIRMSSMAGFQALLDDSTRQDGRYHRIAALQHNYSMVTYPMLSDIPYEGDDGGTPPPVTEDGVGTLCMVDGDCPGDGVETCLSEGGGPGFCTREGCDAGECGAPYVCCRECAEAVAAMLPFEGSACLPAGVVPQLTAAPVSCTCD